MKQREKTIPEPGKPRLPEALERLVQLYEAIGQEGRRGEVAKGTGRLQGRPEEAGEATMTANAFAQGDGQQSSRPGPRRSMGICGSEHGRFRVCKPVTDVSARLR